MNKKIDWFKNKFEKVSEDQLIEQLEQDIKNIENPYSAEILQREIDRLERQR
ncbi:hypothetical protein JZO73_00140 [Enterococcus plantarum]|uniref:hypothetical protein n=1 Tax=Enterococcus plantarum TaxID=1077675 RepID=UPI001A8E4A7A|nr:hypothetical protein [Enterococcus plantarum]MBO0465938.1 hypothetical protein [Enterococcus plantarum]